MTKKFLIVHESEIEGTPAQVFQAVTTGISGWMWPMEIEPKLGGEGPFGSTITAWDPAHRFANRLEGEDGFFNELGYDIRELANGTTWLKYTHKGVFFADWDNQYNAATQHTAFYLHTLGQYVQYFSGRQAAFAQLEGPEASGAPDAFETVKKALGIADGGAGGHLSLTIAGLGKVEATVDYLDPNFIGLRTSDTMIRFFGRNAFGALVGISVHLFADDDDSNGGDADGGDAVGGDADAAGAAWEEWLKRQFPQ